jgi:ABC-type uncharacterized transport system involved in gliding motility auxiliary subunit
MAGRGGFAGLRGVRRGGSVLATSLLTFGILVMLNYLGARRHARFDWTAEDRFSLSPQTRQILKSLDRDVELLAFYPGDDPEQVPLRRLLDEYRGASGRLRIDFIDPDREPGRTARYGVHEPGLLVAVGDRRERAKNTGEEGITNALLRALRGRKVNVGFLSGHGERDPGDRDREGYAAATAALNAASYQVSRVLSLTTGSIPDSIDLLVIAGPRSEPQAGEIAAIERFLSRGGRLLALLDPSPSAGLDSLFLHWNVLVGDDRVVDPRVAGRLVGLDEFTPIVNRYNNNPITRGINFVTFYPLARSISRTETLPDSTSAWTLFQSGGGSWAETSPEQSPPVLDPGRDRLGPIPLAAAIQHPGSSGARLVVFGDSDFCANKYWRLPGSGDLFMNAVAWLSERGEEISVRARTTSERRVELTQQQSRAVLVTGVFLLPLLIVSAGVWVGWRRHGR